MEDPGITSTKDPPRRNAVIPTDTTVQTVISGCVSWLSLIRQIRVGSSVPSQFRRGPARHPSAPRIDYTTIGTPYTIVYYFTVFIAPTDVVGSSLYRLVVVVAFM